MKTFELDTSGVALLPLKHMGDGSAFRHMAWTDLSPFVQGYIEAAFAAPCSRSATGVPMGEILAARFDKLSHSTLAEILKDCAGLETIYGNEKRSGELFWADRQRGSFKGLNPETRFPPLELYLGDDGLIYMRGR